jgi:DNA-binding CsgD family transcriptional regulator
MGSLDYATSTGQLQPQASGGREGMPGEATDRSELRTRVDALSPRQREILVYVAQHFSSKEIARLLGVSPTTVDSHVAAALARLGIANRREAAALMIELGYTTGLPEARTHSEATRDRHGGNLSTHRWVLPLGDWANRLSAVFRSRNDPSKAVHDNVRLRSRNRETRLALVRFLFDAVYTILFFAVMSAAAYGVDWIIVQWEERHIDPVVLMILRGVSYVLVILGAIGVIAATGLLTARFIGAIWRANG